MFEMLKAIGRAILPKKAEDVPIQSATVHTQSVPPKKGGMLSGSVHLPPPEKVEPEDVRLKIKLTKKGDKLVLDLNDLMDETGAKSVNIKFGGNNITLGGNGNSSVVIGSGNVFSSSISAGSGNVVVDGDYMKVGDGIEMDGDYMRVGNITMGRKKRNR